MTYKSALRLLLLVAHLPQVTIIRVQQSISHMLFFNPETFARTLSLTALVMGPLHEEVIAPVILDNARVDVLYRSISQCQPFSTGDLMGTDEATSAPSTTPTIKQTGLYL